MTVSARVPERYVVNFDNPDCGVGHAITYLNGQLKVALRNSLEVAYSRSQLKKSTSNSFTFLSKRLLKRVALRRDVESHDLGNDLDVLFAPGLLTASRDRLYRFPDRFRYRFLTLPKPAVPTHWREHNDGKVYSEIDRFIRDHPEPFTIFQLPQGWQPDGEFEATAKWFREAYVSARRLRPIVCTYAPDHLNIAVHVRRGDILPGRPFESLSNRMLPDAWYVERLYEVCGVLPGPKHIHIFSDGRDGHYLDEGGRPSVAFQRFAADIGAPASLYINRSFLDDFHHLVSADILIGSRSGMSHLAAVLSRGLKIMPQMWHSFNGVDHLVELGPDRPEAARAAIEAACRNFSATRFQRSPTEERPPT